MTKMQRKWLLSAVLVIVLGLLVFQTWQYYNKQQQDNALASGNGRIEATEIDIATKLGGRLEEVLVAEGDFVTAGQPLARMQTDSLRAQRNEALAQRKQAQQAVAAAKSQVALRESQRDAAEGRLKRSEVLSQKGMVSAQQIDDDRTNMRGAEAALNAASAQVAEAQAAIKTIDAAMARIDVELADSELKAPRAGRVQYIIAHPGEVLGGGGKILNLLDLSDVYMTFFLPETVAGRVAIGSEARIVLDAAPQYVIPAKISFVASAAQFTPKTVETASERQKLMFRVKAQIDRELLLKHIQKVKTGLPGVAWVKIDAQAAWPAKLMVKDMP